MNLQIIATLVLSVAIIIVVFVMANTTDDEMLSDYERLYDLKERATYEMTYYGKVSRETVEEIEELEKKYDIK